MKNYAAKVFHDRAMREYMPEDVYNALQETRRFGRALDPTIADQVAKAMKDWAVDQDATHFTHWFQPMTNMTAGKHDAFLTPRQDGTMIMEFSGRALVQGEPDASSFPSGGLRATFEARGYTAWDPTSPAFIRDGTLYIPTAFCSYTGEALDAKTPLLRSMQTVSAQALRILRLFGNTSSQTVYPTVGLEQEYFLVDRKLYEERLDLKICGRTMIGAKPPKGQELDDHYCGRIRLRVSEFMKDLDNRLWELGVASKTKHNEAAPAQHELAAVHSSVNIACDHNQLMMEVMRIVAKQHGLACLLHEKPFEYVNGSGKHNNWSLATDDGFNLLEPTDNPDENYQFLVFLCAVITAVHRHSDLLRLSAACPGNDLRLGECEAPPTVISINLGNRLYTLLKSIAAGRASQNNGAFYLEMGVETLPNLPRDDSDRNRTSPFAFTGNRFEFRMVGASQSPAFANVVLNTAVGDVLREFADSLSQCEDLIDGVKGIVEKTMREHRAVIFNGNNYSAEWLEEAAERGLPNLRSTVDAIEAMTAPESVELFGRNGVFTDVECHARHDVLLENYIKVTSIEAATLQEMLLRSINPALIRAAGSIAESYNRMSAAGIVSDGVAVLLEELAEYIAKLSEAGGMLGKMLQRLGETGGLEQKAQFMRDEVLPYMAMIRGFADKAEAVTDRREWPFPSYTDLLFRL